jgi:hypothetical protein
MTKTPATSFEIAPSLYLVRQVAASQGTTAAAPQPTNHVAVIDCSGSMTGELPRIREQLKKRLPQLLAEGDTFSLIWFSGRGEAGALIEAEPVATLKDLQDVHKAIDRWLRPIGLTGFKDPLVEAEKLITRVSKKNGNPFALFFMSDGCDNQWSRADILKAIEGIAGKLSSATFVEYGYYADRPLLSAMAEKCGGSLIFADRFDQYVPAFEAKMQQRAVGEKKLAVKVDGDPIGGFVFALDSEKHEITTYGLDAGQATVPAGTDAVWYLSPSKIGMGDAMSRYVRQDRLGQTKVNHDEPMLAGCYAALSLFAVRMKPDIVYPILKTLGDVAFIELFAGCFGKQKYTEFMQAARTAAFYPDVRYTNGYDPTKVPADDAFTVLDLLQLLTEDEATHILLDHPSFEYSRVSRGTLDADENFYVAEQEQLDALKVQLAAAKKPAELKKIQTEIDALLATKRDALKFVPTPAPNGYPLANLVYNENRANISLLVTKGGTVDLSARVVAKEPWAKNIPTTFPTKIWRNYTVVADGLVHVEQLPVVISKQTYQMLKDKASMRLIGDSTLPTCTVVINLKPLPIINRNMVGSVSARDLIETQYELLDAKAHQKVYNSFVKTKAPGAKTADSDLAVKYGEDAAAWLKEQGITDAGFAPKRTQAESTDFYMAKELEVKLKGYSSLPTLENAKAGKGGGGGALMKPVITNVESKLAKLNDEGKAAWLQNQQTTVRAQTRRLIQRMAQKKFAVIVGQVWPSEFKSIDENTLTVKIDGKDIVGTIEMSETEVRI